MTDPEAPGRREAPAAAPGTGAERAPAPALPAAGLAAGPDLTAPRVAAALVDIVLLAGLFVIVAAIAGGIRTGGAGFDIALGGPWVLLYLALVLLYYFALETWAGQTVGKLLLGVQVLRAGGSRPSAAAIAGRTLLRVIDWLPLLYLTGFIAMVATGARRQRLGDLAARTCVARPLASRRRSLALIPLGVVLLAAAVLSAYRGSSAAGTQAYRGHGVWFGYPAGWQVESFQQVGGGGADQLWKVTVGPGTPLDGVTVTAYRLNRQVTAQDIDAVTPEVQSVTRQLFGQLGGSVQAGPEKITMAGLPAVRFGGTAAINGTGFHSTVVFAFSGTTEYFVNCQRTPAEAAAVDQACNQVVGSFTVTGAAQP